PLPGHALAAFHEGLPESGRGQHRGFTPRLVRSALPGGSSSSVHGMRRHAAMISSLICERSRTAAGGRRRVKEGRPLPSSFQLEPTLAQRVRQLREFRNMTVKDLAKLSRFKISRLEEIELGFENWLSSSDRQLLAKALSVEPSVL